MATKIYFFSGTCEWLQLSKNYNRYELDLYLDGEQLEKFKKSGSQWKIREKDGKFFIKPTRSVQKLIKGEIKELGAPTIIDTEGRPVDMKIIGNGSKVTCKVQVFDTMKGKGSELQAIRVDELVKYERNNVEVDETEESPF